MIETAARASAAPVPEVLKTKSKVAIIQTRTRTNPARIALEQRIYNNTATKQGVETRYFNSLTGDWPNNLSIILNGVDAVIVAGSAEAGPAGENPELNQLYRDRVLPVIREALEGGIFVIGICLGEQAVVEALGGKVGTNPEKKESGTVSVMLTEEGREYPLLRGVPTVVSLQSYHRASVDVLPPNSVILGFTDKDPYSFLASDDGRWFAAQTHIDLFTRDDAAEAVTLAGPLYQESLQSIVDTPDAEVILDNCFGYIVERATNSPNTPSLRIRRG